MPRRRGSFRIEAERWGEHLTLDYITSKEDVMVGLRRFKSVSPTKSRAAEDAIECFKTCVGPKEKSVFK
eukprot:1494533-Lingulodinium_polyedra.AAC.1